MKKIIGIFVVLLAGFMPAMEVSAGKIDKGFGRLAIHDYFRAKEYFEKSLKKDEAAAAFGLAQIYLLNNNPFHNLDSARVYVLRSESAFQKVSLKQKLKYLKYSLSDTTLQSLKADLCEMAYLRTEANASIEGLNYFINNYNFCIEAEDAVMLRYSVAFREAKNLDTSSAYAGFIAQYPGAPQIPEAKLKLAEKIYEEETSAGAITDYEKFLDAHPESPFVKEAERMIYILSTAKGTTQAYYQFIKKYPQSPFVHEAWRAIYRQELAELSEEKYLSFRERFPEYPFRSELEKDYRLHRAVFLPVKINGRWGYVNEEGQQAIRPQFSEAFYFSEGLAVVSKEGKYGYINKSGNTVVQYKYDDAEAFKGNYAVVMLGEKYGLITRDGSEVIKPEYEELSSPSDEICVAVSGDKSGYVRTDGSRLTSISFDFADDFKNGYAIASLNELSGILNITGTFTVEPVFGELLYIGPGLLKAQRDGEWGVISVKGDTVVPFMYDAIGEFSNNRALIADEGKCGFIDMSGSVVIPMKFEFSENLLTTAVFEDGLALIRQGNKSVLIDSAGNSAGISGYDETGIPGQGLYPVRKKKKWGYADSTGRLMISLRYDAAETFSGSLAAVRTGKYFGVIDSAGNTIVPAQYDIVSISQGGIIVHSGGRAGLFAPEGAMLIPPSMDRIDFVTETIAAGVAGESRIYFDTRSRKEIWNDMR